MRITRVPTLMVCLALLGLLLPVRFSAQEPVKETDAPVRVEKFEGEHLKLLKASEKFPVHSQDMRPFKEDTWSGAAHLIAGPKKLGDWIELALPVPRTGKYRVAVVLTKAADYGIVQFHLNGKKMSDPIDCFIAGKVVRTGPVDLGEIELSEGKAVLKMTLVGTNPKSVGIRNLFALDYLQLTQLAETKVAQQQKTAEVLPPSNDDLTRKLNTLTEWSVIGGEWKKDVEGIVGKGSSLLQFKGKLPTDLQLEFDMTVIAGCRPRVHFHWNTKNLFYFGTEGERLTLFPYGSGVSHVTGNPAEYRNNVKQRIKVLIEGKTVGFWVNGKWFASGERNVAEDVTLVLSAGDGYSKGPVLFSGFRITAQPSSKTKDEKEKIAVGERDKLKTEVLSADFLPYRDGVSFYTYGKVKLTKPEGAILHLVEFPGDGKINQTTIKMGTAQGVTTTWTKNLSLKAKYPKYHRVKDGFVEIGDHIGETDKVYWEPVIKIGAKVGDTWDWEIPGVSKRQYKISRFYRTLKGTIACEIVIHSSDVFNLNNEKREVKNVVNYEQGVGKLGGETHMMVDGRWIVTAISYRAQNWELKEWGINK